MTFGRTKKLLLPEEWYYEARYAGEKDLPNTVTGKWCPVWDVLNHEAWSTYRGTLEHCIELSKTLDPYWFAADEWQLRLKLHGTGETIPLAVFA